jgi:hypothetical protein
MPPLEQRTIDKDVLYAKYIAEDWPARIGQTADPTRTKTWKTGNYKTHTKWFNAEGDVLAFVIEYHRPGSVSVVRQLRDGDIFYYIE